MELLPGMPWSCIREKDSLLLVFSWLWLSMVRRKGKGNSHLNKRQFESVVAHGPSPKLDSQGLNWSRKNGGRCPWKGLPTARRKGEGKSIPERHPQPFYHVLNMLDWFSLFDTSLVQGLVCRLPQTPNCPFSVHSHPYSTGLCIYSPNLSHLHH